MADALLQEGSSSQEGHITERMLRLVSRRSGHRDNSRFQIFCALVVMDAHLPGLRNRGFTASQIAEWGWVLNEGMPLFHAPGNARLPAHAQVLAKICATDDNWMRTEGYVTFERPDGETVSCARMTEDGRLYAKALGLDIPDSKTVKRLWIEAQARLSLGTPPEFDGDTDPIP